MLELENKIREAIPRLKEVGVGLKFIDRLGFNAEIVYIDNGTVFYFSESDLEVFSVSLNFFGGECKEIVGHPIKINDVLEYITEKNCYGGITISNRFYITNGYKYYFWDLSSVFLADQNDELKKFLNDL